MVPHSITGTGTGKLLDPDPEGVKSIKIREKIKLDNRYR
jgi:hypothetical protein